MVKEELTKNSPLRILEKATHGGLGKGNIAVIASRRGIGKTACLVHIATDKLMRDKHVIHVSFSSRTDHILDWYEDIFREISQKRDLENAMEVHDELVKNRVIMNFNQDGVSMDQVLNSVKAMIENGQKGTDAIVVDGYDFTKNNDGNVIAKVKNFAKEMDLEIWFTDSYEGEVVQEGAIPSNLKCCEENLSVIMVLKNEGDVMNLNLVKDHGNEIKEDLSLILDSKTLLIARK
ncbi:DnaB-like helicase C-terminal domain-containing protein [Spirochaeta isovalerica]|uniref:KaiC/GvpD/RAD55 family RecA-like ATPase n=1 Tax=Spirochaeta isovalerica TaxID=150 RepID=A0A841REL6_9SPIO|nr:DnaB-like helicase C-terminal domain-containing protein [Spirochaeta isovalerica]MBB6482056.1 KaiC/GvpD/RAD55 family RecA-like ATPase [Spirochaeta isovalerica]